MLFRASIFRKVTTFSARNFCCRNTSSRFTAAALDSVPVRSTSGLCSCRTRKFWGERMRQWTSFLQGGTRRYLGLDVGTAEGGRPHVDLGFLRLLALF